MGRRTGRHCQRAAGRLMSDDKPKLQDPHFAHLCQLVLEAGLPFPERNHRQIAQRMLELLGKVPNTRGRPKSHSASAGWMVDKYMKLGDLTQAEARKLLVKHTSLFCPYGRSSAPTRGS